MSAVVPSLDEGVKQGMVACGFDGGEQMVASADDDKWNPEPEVDYTDIRAASTCLHERAR